MNPAAQISRTTGAKARARKLAATIWDRAPGARPRLRGTPFASTRSLFAAKRFSISEPDNEQQRGLKSNAVSLDQIKQLFVGGFAPIRHTTFLQAAMDDGRTDGLILAAGRGRHRHDGQGAKALTQALLPSAGPSSLVVCAFAEKPNGSAEYQPQNCRECDKPTCVASRFRLSVCRGKGGAVG